MPNGASSQMVLYFMKLETQNSVVDMFQNLSLHARVKVSWSDLKKIINLLTSSFLLCIKLC